MATHFAENESGGSPYHFDVNSSSTPQAQRSTQDRTYASPVTVTTAASSSEYSPYPAGVSGVRSPPQQFQSDQNTYNQENSYQLPQQHQSVAGFNKSVSQQQYQSSPSSAPQVRATVRSVTSQEQQQQQQQHGSSAQYQQQPQQQYVSGAQYQQQPQQQYGSSAQYQQPQQQQYGSSAQYQQPQQQPQQRQQQVHVNYEHQGSPQSPKPSQTPPQQQQPHGPSVQYQQQSQPQQRQQQVQVNYEHQGSPLSPKLPQISPQQHQNQYDPRQQPGQPSSVAGYYQTPGSTQNPQHEFDQRTQSPSQSRDQQVKVFIHVSFLYKPQL